MRKIKVLKSGYPDEMDDIVQEWMDENPNIYIISVSGAIRDDGDCLTWILYEKKKSESDLLNS